MHSQEIAELNSILNSRVLRAITDEYQRRLQKEANQAVRENNPFKAYGELCKYDSIDRVYGLIKLKIEELQKGE